MSFLEFPVRVTSSTLRIGVPWTYSLPFYFWPILNSVNYNHIINITLFYMRQNWMTQLILAISLWEVISFWSERILLLICMILHFMCREALLLREMYVKKTLLFLTYVFDWLYFIQCLTYFSFFDHLLHLYAHLLMLFRLTMMRFPWSICFSLKNLTAIIGTGKTDRPDELCYNFPQLTLLKCLTFLLRSLTVTHTALLFWIYFFLLTLVWLLVVQLISLQFPITFCQTQNVMSRFIA